MARGVCYSEMLIRAYGELLRSAPPVKNLYARLLIRTYDPGAAGDWLSPAAPAAGGERPSWHRWVASLGGALGRLPAEVWLMVMGALYLGMAVALAILERQASMP